MPPGLGMLLLIEELLHVFTGLGILIAFRPVI